MASPTDIIIGILATYILAYSITQLDGPFDIFNWLRDHIDPAQLTWVGRGINCPHCVGFWVAWLIAIPITNSWWVYPIVALALSGGNSFMHKLTEKDYSIVDGGNTEVYINDYDHLS